MKEGLLVLDEGGQIFNEYRQQHLSFSGQPGPGDVFFKWLVDNRYNADRVSLVSLSRDPNKPERFTAFPNDPQLEAFDPSDRKFVAVALTHQDRPAILNATDSDWWKFKDALLANGVIVRFVCGEQRFQAR